MMANLDNKNLDFIAKQQGLFRRAFAIPKIKDANDAKQAVSDAMKLYADGEVSEYQIKTVQSAADSYVKMHEIADLEARLKVLEDKQDGK